MIWKEIFKTVTIRQRKRLFYMMSDEFGFPVYIAKPTGPVRGGLIVIHEVWGLVDHTKKVADSFAKDGYLVMAPELLGNGGLSPDALSDAQKDLFSGNEERRTRVQPVIRQLTAPQQQPDFAQKTVDKLEKLFNYLYDQPDLHQNVAVMGFCFGGSYSYSLAVHEPRLKAAVPFYGHADFSVDELKKIKCPILAFYGENDERLMDGLPKLREDMEEAGVNYSAQVYSDCGHAFFNDSNPYAYNEAAAKDARAKVLNFLAENFSSTETTQT